MKIKILLVDDEKIVLKSLAKVLEKEGYEVKTASSAKEALFLVKSQDFSLLISDLRLPDKNGIELVREIRAYCSKKGKTKLNEILISGYADIDYYQQASDLNIKSYLHKPFDNKDLIQAVRGVTGEKAR